MAFIFSLYYSGFVDFILFNFYFHFNYVCDSLMHRGDEGQDENVTTLEFFSEVAVGPEGLQRY